MLRVASGTARGLIEHQPVTLHRLIAVLRSATYPGRAMRSGGNLAPKSGHLECPDGRRGMFSLTEMQNRLNNSKYTRLPSVHVLLALGFDFVSHASVSKA